MYCFKCGRDMGKIEQYPHECPGCRLLHFDNPIPVVVGLVPVWGAENEKSERTVGAYAPMSFGLLTVKRKGGENDGKLALPGGYVVRSDESYGHALSRELLEETGMEFDPKSWRVLGIERDANGNMLVFCQTFQKTNLATVTSEIPDNPETYSKHVSYAGEQLCFPHHQQWFNWYLNPKGPDPSANR